MSGVHESGLNVYQILPYIVTIISKTFCYPSATAAASFFMLTVGDLKKLSYNDIRHIKNMGPASAESIKSALGSFGIFLR